MAAQPPTKYRAYLRRVEGGTDKLVCRCSRCRTWPSESPRTNKFARATPVARAYWDRLLVAHRVNPMPLGRSHSCHCEERRDEAISTPSVGDCFASLAMTYRAALSSDFAFALGIAAFGAHSSGLGLAESSGGAYNEPPVGIPSYNPCGLPKTLSVVGVRCTPYEDLCV